MISHCVLVDRELRSLAVQIQCVALATEIRVILIEIVSNKTRLPLSISLILAGFLGSEVALLFVDDISIRWFHIRDLILYLLIPIILFQTILKLDFRLNTKDMWMLLVLALPVSLLTGVSLGFLLYWFIGDAAGFPIHSAMLAGMLLTTTSPATMGILLKLSHAPKQLRNLMLGESLFNGLIAVMLFFFLLPLQDINMVHSSVLTELVLKFILHTTLGAIAGGSIAWLLIQLMRVVNPGYRHLIITQAGCFLSYYLANTMLGISGVASLLPTALVFLHHMQKNGTAESYQFLLSVWTYKRNLSAYALFILMGISLTFSIFLEQWLAMIIGIVAALSVRAITVFLIIPPTRKMLSAPFVGKAYYPALWWGGMRGGTTVALALSLPETITGWWTIQAIAYGAVLFSFAFQAPFLPALIKRANQGSLSVKTK